MPRYFPLIVNHPDACFSAAKAPEGASVLEQLTSGWIRLTTLWPGSARRRNVGTPSLPDFPRPPEGGKVLSGGSRMQDRLLVTQRIPRR
jgi:hypothetical protein